MDEVPCGPDIQAVMQADGNSTGVGNPPGYCYREQPAWSAYRESSFGHGTLDLVNGTHALWSCKRLSHPRGSALAGSIASAGTLVDMLCSLVHSVLIA